MRQMPRWLKQVIEDAGIMAFVFMMMREDLEPHLQRTAGVRLAVNRVDAERVQEVLHNLEDSPCVNEEQS